MCRNHGFFTTPFETVVNCTDCELNEENFKPNNDEYYGIDWWYDIVISFNNKDESIIGDKETWNRILFKYRQSIKSIRATVSHLIVKISFFFLYLFEQVSSSSKLQSVTICSF